MRLRFSRWVGWFFLLIFVGGCAATVEPPSVPDPGEKWGQNRFLPQKLQDALVQGQVEWLDGPGPDDLPVRVYGREGNNPPLILLHGLQSHSGWFAQSAAFIADLGHPVYALDRRGSGLSQAPRGDVKDYQAWILEILAVAEQVRYRHGHQQVYLMGQCFGAIPAAAFADRYPDLVKGLLLPTPGIYTKARMPLRSMTDIFFSSKGRNDDYFPVPLESRWFSDLDNFETFILNDPLALRAATGDFYWQAHQVRQHIQKSPSRLSMPVLMAISGNDPVADNEKNLAWVIHSASPRIMLLRYEDARHVLEFSPERDRFFADLAAWLEYVESL